MVSSSGSRGMPFAIRSCAWGFHRPRKVRVSIRQGDLLIRDVSPSEPGQFVVVDAITFDFVAGPFGVLFDAAAAAYRLRPSARVWRENLDQRGRELAPPTQLPLPA